MVTKLNTEVKIFGVMKSVVLRMETVCVWCPGAQERTRQLQTRGVTVSHGMCADCAKKMEKK